MVKLLLIASAGALGTLARYGLGHAVSARWGSSGFPWGTFAVNVAGCLLFGLFVGVAEHRFPMSAQTRAVVLVGFMGAFTTFSALAFDTGGFIGGDRWGLALLNIAAHNIVGIACILVGLRLGRLL